MYLFQFSRDSCFLRNTWKYLLGAKNEIPPIAKEPVAGSADICFISPTPISQVIEHFTSS